MFKLDFDTKPSVWNWVMIGVMAVTFIVFVKWAMNKFPVPGLKEVIEAV